MNSIFFYNLIKFSSSFHKRSDILGRLPGNHELAVPNTFVWLAEVRKWETYANSLNSQNCLLFAVVAK